MCRCLLFSSLFYTAVIRKTSEYKIKDKIMQNIKLKRNFSICAVWEFYYTNKRKEYWKDLCSKRNSKNETQKRKHAKQNQYQSRWGTAKPLGICCSWHSITLPLFFWKKTSKLPFCRFFTLKILISKNVSSSWSMKKWTLHCEKWFCKKCSFSY